MKPMRYLIIMFLLGTTSTGLACTGDVVKQFKAPYTCPTGLTFDGTNLWVADHKADKLSCLDTETGEIMKEITSPGFWPMGLAWDGEYLWNVDGKQAKIFKVDPADGTILMVIDAPTRDPQGIAWDGSTLWVSDEREKKIMKIDLSDGTAVKSFDAPATYAQGLTFDGTYLWCADRIADEIHMIDTQNGEVIIIFKSPGPYPRGLAWDGQYVWNVDYQTDEIYQLVRQDDELCKLDETRDAKITFTHEVKPYGQGKIQELDVYVSIPEDLPQQQILSKTFGPAIFDVLKDKWGQSYAHFNYQDIEAGSTISSTMIVDAKISEINYSIFPDRCGTLTQIPPRIRRTYTENGSKYQTDDPYIQELAREIAGDERNPYWIARKIFDHVRDALEYKLEGGWNVAPVVLKRGTGSCSEYAFSFIALCRAAGLPARYVGSVVVRRDDASLDDVFHRWTEVYLPNYGWIPIDPSRGDKPLPRDRAMSIGHLANTFLITTLSGGDSEYMGWYYNCRETYKTDPKVEVNVEAFAEWEPLEVQE